MSMNISISRSSEIAESRSQAIINLDNRVFKYGEPVAINFYNEQNEVETILALGTSNSKGSYNIINSGQYKLVWDVVNELPDISLLVNGEVYLYHNTSENVWYTVNSLNKISKTLTTVLPNIIFVNLTDNMLWVSNGDSDCRSLSDFVTRDDITNIISDFKSEFTNSDWNETNPTKPSYIKNKPDITKAETAVSYVHQELTEEQKAIARSNIGAGSNSFSGLYNDLQQKPVLGIEGGENGTGSASITIGLPGETPITIQNIVTDPNYQSFSSDEKQKLAAIESGAEVNVQGDWLDTDENSDSYIKNKPVYTIETIQTETGKEQTLKLKRTIGEESVYLGDSINIPLPTRIYSGVIKTCTVADSPVQGYVVGTRYIDITVVTEENTTEHKYIDLTSTRYSSDINSGISINDSTSKISLKITEGNGLGVTNSGLQLDLATIEKGGAMSPIDKAKLDTVENGAEVNQNAFSNIKVGETVVEADTKSDTVEIKGSGSASVSATEDVITINVPTTIKNPKSLKFINGDTTISYDGEAEKYITKADLGLGSVDNIKQVPYSYLTDEDSGLVVLSGGKIPERYLPSSVDELSIGYLYEGKFYTGTAHETEIEAKVNKIYVDAITNKTYRWAETTYEGVTSGLYIEISKSLAIGDTVESAFNGRDGKTAYTHATDEERITEAKTKALYKISVTDEGHISEAEEIEFTDIFSGNASDVGLGEVDGLEADDVQSAVEEMNTNITALMSKVFPLECEWKSASATTIEVSTTITPGGTLNIKRQGNDVTSSSIIKYGTTEYEKNSNGQLLLPEQVNNSAGSKSYSITVTQPKTNGDTKTLTLTYTWTYYRYYGAVSDISGFASTSNDGSIVVTDLSKLVDKIKTLTKELSTTYTLSKDSKAGNYYIFAVKGTHVLKCQHAQTGGTITGCATGNCKINRVNDTDPSDSTAIVYTYFIVPASSNDWSFKILK